MIKERPFLKLIEWKVNLFISFVLFGLFYFQDRTWQIPLIIATAVFLFLLLFSYLSNHLGTKRQEEILESEALLQFRARGFRKVEKGFYAGLFGQYDGFCFDIYYSNVESFKGRAGRVLVFNAYYTGETQEQIEKEIARLTALTKRNNTNLFKMYTLEWYSEQVIYKMSLGVLNPSAKRGDKHFKKFLEILSKEKLTGMPFEELENKRAEDPSNLVPLAESYIEWLEENNLLKD